MPRYAKDALISILQQLDFGAAVAEHDDLLESARVETSTFTDLLNDRVDLIPGTKGSGKTALYRIFVEFLSDLLLEQRKVVVAHGVHQHGDVTFQAFRDHFDEFNENDFVNFWCIYLVSLAKEEFVNSERYRQFLTGCAPRLRSFESACRAARIPAIPGKQSLKGIITSVLHALKTLRPAMKVNPDSGDMLFTVAVDDAPKHIHDGQPLPQFVSDIAKSLEELLECADLHLWLMIDRLDEIFPRRSQTETLALRGLLRTLRIFENARIRVKVFLRDDILSQITVGSGGFTALSHVTARQADRLQWSEEQILSMIMRRLSTSEGLRALLEIDEERLLASRAYRRTVFYDVFPATVHRGSRQSATLRWIYNHVADGSGVVTPRDVIDLLSRAKQRQYNEYRDDPEGDTEYIIGSAAIRYGLSELSKKKCETYLQAEFEHFWPDIKKFFGGRTEYTQGALQRLLGRKWESKKDDLLAIGVLSEKTREGKPSYQIPFLYRDGLELTQGCAT